MSERACHLCGATPARWTQFRFGQMRACEECRRRHGGSFESASPALPLPRDADPVDVDDLL